MNLTVFVDPGPELLDPLNYLHRRLPDALLAPTRLRLSELAGPHGVRALKVGPHPAPPSSAPDPAPVAADVDRLLGHFRGGGATGSLAGAVPIPDSLIGAAPPPIGPLLRSLDHDHQRGVVAVSALTTASALLPNVRFEYHGLAYGTPIMATVVARAGSGKGSARHGTALADAVDARVHAAAAAAASDGGQAPAFGVVLPGNASQAALTDHFARATVPTLLVETEIDSYLGANKQEWGSTSAVLRAAFEHEPVRVARLTRSVNVGRPELAVVFAGTHDQFAALVPSAEDGLFSRFMWHTFEGSDEWLDPWAVRTGPGPRDVARRGGLALDPLHAALAARPTPLFVALTAGQRVRHTEVFEALNAWRTGGASVAMGSVVRRAGVTACRAAVVLAVLREHAAGRDFGDPTLQTLEPSDVDLEAGLALALVGVDHANRLLCQMPRREPPRGRKEAAAHRLLDVLPRSVRRTEVLDIAEQEGLTKSARTVDSYLKVLVDTGMVENRLGASGLYDRLDDVDPVPGVGGVLYTSTAPPNFRRMSFDEDDSWDAYGSPAPDGPVGGATEGDDDFFEDLLGR